MVNPENSSIFDFIVIGLGSMGSSALYHLASRGHRVMGLEQFDVCHDRGSHSGQTRIIRKAYFEHPDYIPLLQRAYENWESIENISGEYLLSRTGLYYAGPHGHDQLDRIRESASLYNIQLDRMDATRSLERFPQFSIPAHFEALFEPDAGFVRPEATIQTYVSEAINSGAQIRTREAVQGWRLENGSVRVQTDRATYNCKKLVITAGPWTSRILPVPDQLLKVTRQVLAWIRPVEIHEFSHGRFPCWMIVDDELPGSYYGFPILSEERYGAPTGLKIAYHFPGQMTDPDKVNRRILSEDIDHLTRFLQKYIPGSFDSIEYASTCLYSNTPDENFVIDNLPGYEDHVCAAWGFSGHGFKFVPVVGEILADLAIEGRTEHPIGFLNAGRFRD